MCRCEYALCHRRFDLNLFCSESNEWEKSLRLVQNKTASALVIYTLRGKNGCKTVLNSIEIDVLKSVGRLVDRVVFAAGGGCRFILYKFWVVNAHFYVYLACSVSVVSPHIGCIHRKRFFLLLFTWIFFCFEFVIYFSFSLFFFYCCCCFG